MTLAVVTFMGLLLALELAALVMVLANHLLIPAPGKPPYRGPPDDPPLVSILVPARNEEQNIRDCVESLMAQDYPRFEVIVADDGSTDRTPHVLSELQARYPDLKVLRPPPVPPDWINGKSHALWHAEQASAGQWLLTVDADTRPFPHAVSEAIGDAIETRADLLIAFPMTDCIGFWEKTVIPAMLKPTLTTPWWRVNNPKSKLVAATGAFMLFRRSAYEAIGGFEAIKQERVEDIALARRSKGQGLRLRFVSGTYLSHVRQYSSLRQIVRAVTHQYFRGGVGGSVLLALVNILGLLLLTVVPWVALAGFGVLWLSGHTAPVYQLGVLLAACQCAVITAGHHVICRLYRIRGGPAVLDPLGGLVGAVAMLRSTVVGLLGRRDEWRGRQS